MLSHLRLTPVNYYRRRGFYFYNIAGPVEPPSSPGEHLEGWGLICALCTSIIGNIERVLRGLPLRTSMVFSLLCILVLSFPRIPCVFPPF